MTTDPALLAERLGAVNEATPAGAPDAGGDRFTPNYNVAPSATIVAVVSRHRNPDDRPTRRIRAMRWGLVPPWAKTGADGGPDLRGPQLINARAETATASPAFRAAARHRRCLIPMDGFYEWRANPDTPARQRSRKTPFYIHARGGAPLLVAGLWSVWRPERDAQAPPLLSCTIITTDAAGPLAEIHDRMPLIVPANRWDDWLDPDAPADDALLAGRPDTAGLALHEVSTLVNSVRNNGPQLIEAAVAEPEQPTLL